MTTSFKTGVGRVVWGHPAKSTVKKDMTTKQPILKDGVQVEQWAFGVAFPKAEFEQFVWPNLSAEAATGYPNGVPANFAWKYVDGDGVDSAGKPFSEREGYAGCYILTCSTTLKAPALFKLSNGVYIQHPSDQIKPGDHVVVAVDCTVNVPSNRTHTPGLYINPDAVEHVAYDTEIFHGPDAQTLFGGQVHQIPSGASATPVATQGGGQMQMQQQPPQQQMQPAHDFVQNAGQEQPQPGQMQPGMIPNQ